MKRNYLYIAFCALGAIFSSCSDWFDITPKTDVKAEDFFETENGFESALAGAYLTLPPQRILWFQLYFRIARQAGHVL